MIDDSPPRGPGEGERWLPPEPAGPEPERSRPGSGREPPPEGWPPPDAGTPGSPPPPAEPRGYAPPTYAHAPPQPIGAPSATEAGNGAAVAALVLGIVALALLLVTIGFSSVISLACAVPAIFLGRSGRRNVDEGRTRKHRGLAQAGFVMGIIGTILSVLAIVFWTLLIVLSDEFQTELERELDRGLDQSAEPSTLRLLLVRAGAQLVRLLLG